MALRLSYIGLKFLPTLVTLIIIEEEDQRACYGAWSKEVMLKIWSYYEM